MAATNVRGGQVLDGSIQRVDLDITTVGQSVIRKVIGGTGISVSGNGADAGTGDVTITNTSPGTPTPPGGSNQQIQFNNSGAFGGIPSFTYDGTIPGTVLLTPASNTYATGLLLTDTTVAPSAGNQQYSPSLIFHGSGWKTAATAGPQNVDIRLTQVPLQASVAPTAQLEIAGSINNAAYGAIAIFQRDSNSAGHLLLDAGSIGAPAYAFLAQLNTGIYSTTAGDLGLSGSGTDMAHFTTANFWTLGGIVSLGGTYAAPALVLRSSAGLQITTSTAANFQPVTCGNTAGSNTPGVGLTLNIDNTVGVGGTGLGVGLRFQAEDDTSNDQEIGNILGVWGVGTHATRTGYLDFTITNSGTTGGSKMRLFGSGGLSVNSTTDPGAGIINANSGFAIANANIFPVTVARGGTGQITALAARGSGGLNVESRSTFSDANYTGLATDNYIATTTTAFTAQRTVTLPAANSQNPGERLYIGDDGGAINGAFTLVIARAGSDTIHGGTASLTLFTPRAAVILESDGVSNWTVVSRSPAVRVQVLTTGTTFTSTIGVKAMWVECIGGGGGGGGAVASASNSTAGSGGGGGGYAAGYILSPKASYTYAIGGAGGGGAATGANGTAGGTTSFDSPAVISASGGALGSGNATGSTTPGGITLGAAGGAGSLGDVQMAGNSGVGGIRYSGTQALGGLGGAAARGGGGGPQGSGAGQVGFAGGNYGGGGSGASSTSATGNAGGNGAAGCIIVTEFF